MQMMEVTVGKHLKQGVCIVLHSLIPLSGSHQADFRLTDNQIKHSG